MKAGILKAGAGALLLVWVLFLYVPLLLFTANADEFDSGFLQILQFALPGAAALPIVIVLLGWISPRLVRERLAALMIILSLLTYIQSTFLVWDYGLLDGGEIRWSSFWQNAWIDMAIWVPMLLGALIFSRRLCAAGTPVLSLLAAILLINTASLLLSGNMKWKGKSTDEKLLTFYSFSPESNVIFVMLDAFASPAFEFLLANDSQYAKMFPGFTYYRNATGSFPTTFPSIPAIMTGEEYDNSLPIRQFIFREVKEKSIPSMFADAGYQVDLATLPAICPALTVNNCMSLPQLTANDPRELAKAEASRLLDVALFRASPQPLKKVIYNENNWFLQSATQPLALSLHQGAAVALPEIFERRADISAAKPGMKFFHLPLPHRPVRLDENCRRPERRQKNGKMRAIKFTDQAGCALKLTNRIFNKLRELNIYDSSYIVVLADHGVSLKSDLLKKARGFPQPGYAAPLLMLKPPGSRAPFAASEAYASLADLPATFADWFGFPVKFKGESILKLNPQQPRERIFRHYKWEKGTWDKDYLPEMREFVITGSPYDTGNWRETRTLPTGSQP